MSWWRAMGEFISSNCTEFLCQIWIKEAETLKVKQIISSKMYRVCQIYNLSYFIQLHWLCLSDCIKSNCLVIVIGHCTYLEIITKMSTHVRISPNAKTGIQNITRVITKSTDHHMITKQAPSTATGSFY